MPYRAIHLRGLLVLVLCLLTGCHTSIHTNPAAGATPPEVQPAWGALATPPELLGRFPAADPPAALPYTSGSEYLAQPCQRLTPDGAGGKFQPAAAEGSVRLADAAYGVYRLDLAAYTSDQALSLDWSAALDTSVIWIGLSDWAKGCWQWFAAPADGVLAPAVCLPPYTHPDTHEVLVALVVLGEQECALRGITAGRRPAFSAQGTVLAPYGSGLAGATVSVGAGLPTDITDANGRWQIRGIPPGVHTATVSKTGCAFYPKMRDFAVDLAPVDVDSFQQQFSGWTHYWGDNGNDYATAIAEHPDGSVWLSGWNDSGYGCGTVSHFSSAGGLLQYTEFQTISGEYNVVLEDVAIAGDGSVYFGGIIHYYDAANKYDIVVVKYASDGAVSWCKQYGSPAFEYFRAITCSIDEGIYIIGDVNDGIGNTQGLVLKISDSGTVLWQKEWDTDYDTQFRDVATDSTNNIYITGSLSFSDSEAISKLIMIQMTSSGGSNWQIMDRIACATKGDKIAIDGQDNIYIAGTLTTHQDDIYAIILNIAKNGDDIQQFEWCGDVVECNDLACDAQGQLHLMGSYNASSDSSFSQPFHISLNSDLQLLAQQILISTSTERLINLYGIACDNMYGVYYCGQGFDYGSAWESSSNITSNPGLTFTYENWVLSDYDLNAIAWDGDWYNDSLKMDAKPDSQDIDMLLMRQTQ